MITIRLTEAELSALECAGLGEFDDNDRSAVIIQAWQGRSLAFDEADRDALWTLINDLSNSEDESNDRKPDAYARRASRALARLASMVLLGRRT
jgi:hypothetical protein